MQVYAYTDEVIRRLNAYARSMTPQPRVRYDLVHQEVYVPLGCLPIKITQFFQWNPSNRYPLDYYHWAISIPTSSVRGLGNFYELAGDSQSYHIKSTIDGFNSRRGFERGSHTVGYILPLMLPHLEAHLALVPVENSKQLWNTHNWVCNALKRLNHPLMFAVGVAFEKLVTQMAIVSAAWEEGDAN